MALTADQLTILRAEIGGPPPSDAEANSLYDLYGGLVGVARHVWKARYAVLLQQPSAFTVVGDYSQSTSANLKAMRDRIAELGAYPDDSDDIPPMGEILVFKTVPMERVGQDR